VPACEPFTITWQPTTPNTVSVLLLKGPATNVVKFGPSLAEGIANSGSLVWTPTADLPTTNGAPLGYGIQIIDDVTGQYQYSTQFGISAGNCAAVVSSSSSLAPVASSSSAAGGYGYSAAPASSSIATSTPTPSSTNVYQSIAPYPTTVMTQSSAVVVSTGVPAGNNTIEPTGSMTVPASLYPGATNATTSRLPEATTNAGSAVQAGLSFAGAFAAFALML
jgi:hypothetical protein